MLKKKKKKQALEALKKKFREKLENKKNERSERAVRLAPPPYDDIYFEGLKTLDLLAGEEIKTLKGIVHFSDDIWKSKARFDPDVP